LQRIDKRAEVIAALSSIFLNSTTDAWVKRLDAANVPCSPVNTIVEMLDHPQVVAMDMLIKVADRQGRLLPLVGVPLNLSETPAKPGGAPPQLGEHTDDILRAELGYDDARIAALRKEGAI
jgi:crotonobetainyl-CoA:carnitine CoA-transferase CaiB-like acyl-CoA transferase